MQRIGGTKTTMTLEMIREAARTRGGECLSDSFDKAREKLRFRCAKGHEFETIPGSVVRGKKTWCPKCSGRGPLSLETFAEIARERGGECLSTTYVRLEHPLLFRCANGHEFSKPAHNVRHAGGWCDECESERRLERLARMAEERGGRLISDKYLGAHGRHIFECAEEHIFDAVAHHVTNSGMWCGECQRASRRKKPA